MAAPTVQMNRPRRPRRVAVISDVHGNRHALDAVLEGIGRSAPDEIWCLGDLVGYGAEPDACVDRVLAVATTCLVGNHDMAVTGGVGVAEFSQTAAAAAHWTREAMRPDTLAELGRRTPIDLGQPLGMYHASPRDPVWEYVLSSKQADACLDAQLMRVSLIGHSHVALSFGRQDGAAVDGALRGDGSVVDVSTGRWLLNPGSVGQPRDGDPRAAWLEVDLEQWTAEWHRIDYDIDGAANAIRAAGLPDSLAARLYAGQ